MKVELVRFGLVILSFACLVAGIIGCLSSASIQQAVLRLFFGVLGFVLFGWFSRGGAR